MAAMYTAPCTMYTLPFLLSDPIRTWAYGKYSISACILAHGQCLWKLWWFQWFTWAYKNLFMHQNDNLNPFVCRCKIERHVKVSSTQQSLQCLLMSVAVNGNYLEPLFVYQPKDIYLNHCVIFIKCFNTLRSFSGWGTYVFHKNFHMESKSYLSKGT